MRAGYFDEKSKKKTFATFDKKNHIEKMTRRGVCFSKKVGKQFYPPSYPHHNDRKNIST